MDECIEDHIRKGLDKEASCDECIKLKAQALIEFEDENEIEEIIDTPFNEMGLGDEDGVEVMELSIDDFSDDSLGDDLGGGLESQIAELIDLAKNILTEVSDNDMDVLHETADDIIENTDNLIEDHTHETDDVDGLDNDGDGDHDMDDHEDEDDDDDPDGGGEEEACMSSNEEGDPVQNAMETMQTAMDGLAQAMEGGDSMGAESMTGEEAEEDVPNSVEFEEEMSDEEADEEACMAENEAMTDFEEGEILEEAENSNEDLSQFAMSSSTIKRYNETESLRSLTEADTMQINDILGDRKISDSAKEVEVAVEQSQDVDDIGKVQDGSTMGDEEKFDAKDPDVPTGDATMGPDEDQDFEKAKVPAGDGEMGSEGDTIDTDVDVNMQGHAQHVANSNKATKTAGEVTIENPVALEDSADLKSQTLSDGSTLGAEEKFDAKDPDVFSGDAKMGPDEDQDFEKPTVPAGDGEMGHEKETIDTDVDTEIKGTTIAHADKEVLEAKVRAERIRIATKLASLEMMDGEIAPQDFDKEVDDLASSSVPTLKKLLARYEAKRIVKVANKQEQTLEKTANTEPQGLEVPVVINTQTNTANLKDEIKGLFSLQQKIDDFEDYERTRK
jgi:hypothetical protein